MDKEKEKNIRVVDFEINFDFSKTQKIMKNLDLRKRMISQAVKSDEILICENLNDK